MSDTQKKDELLMCVENIQKILSPYFTGYGEVFFKIYPGTLDIILFADLSPQKIVPIFMQPILKHVTLNTSIRLHKSPLRRPTYPGSTVTCLDVGNIPSLYPYLPKISVDTLETVIPCILDNQRMKKQQLQKMTTLSSQIITLLAKKTGLAGSMDPENPIISVCTANIDSMYKFEQFLNKEKITHQTYPTGYFNIASQQNLQKLRQSLKKLGDI
jgi:hypothetical protein